MDYSTAQKLMSIYDEIGAALNSAGEVVGTLPSIEEQKKLRRPIGRMAADLWIELRLPLVRQFPELDPDKGVEPDSPLTAEQGARVAKLTASELQEIDDALLANAKTQWRKVAMIVALTMNQLEDQGRRQDGIPDVFYSRRVRLLVEASRLEAAGNLDYMRFSEVRLTCDGT